MATSMSVGAMRAAILHAEAIEGRVRSLDELRRRPRIDRWLDSVFLDAVDRNIVQGVFLEDPTGELVVLPRRVG